MKVACMAAGGVGGYFGARLQQAGPDVTFFTRGLTVESGEGSATLKVRAMQDPGEAGIAEVVLFAVKLWDTDGAAAQIRPLVGPETVVIPFQNGVESIDRLRKV